MHIDVCHRSEVAVDVALAVALLVAVVAVAVATTGSSWSRQPSCPCAGICAADLHAGLGEGDLQLRDQAPDDGSRGEGLHSVRD